MQKIRFWLKLISLLLLWGVLLPRLIKAQTLDLQLITAVGQTFSNGGYRLDCSLGEPLAQTFDNGATLSQGFQQVWLVATPVKDFEGEDWAVQVFPNPTVGVLHVQAEEPMNAQLFDQSGRLVLATDLAPHTGVLNLEALPAGNYFLYLRNAQELGSKSFKIQKVQ